ncbi:hypothetical protein [Anaeromicropila herbilytica]|uniref:Uncharacterized protein n=1 Tax=Anaeromicropila herbilytica TaxID=2785025 RepID=A0A7R7EK21_9FIRM|nr:hypothetical protein [Anaeromicropila herbilytica]BCN30240.1 hypothetical protein bsdtb5_15350 [Anaeromicropila herbilytica]
MQEHSVYLFIGKPSNDFIIYLATILQNLSISVLIIDETNQMKQCIQIPEEQPEPIHYRGIDFINMETLLEKYSSLMGDMCLQQDIEACLDMQYQVYFILSDLNDSILKELEESKDNKNLFLKHSYFSNNLKQTYLITDSTKNNIEKVTDFINLFNQKVTIILRDICEGKLNMQYYLNTYFERYEYSIRRYQIPLDEVDYEYRIRLEYETFQDFKNISKEYQKVLMEVAKEMLKEMIIDVEVSDKTLKKAFQLARKGVVYENSIF